MHQPRSTHALAAMLLVVPLAACDGEAPPPPTGGPIVEHVRANEAKMRQARALEAVMLAARAQSAAQSYYMVRGELPRDNSVAGLAAPEAYVSASVSRMELNGFGSSATITVTLTDQIEAGSTLVWEASLGAGGQLAWACRGGTLSAQFRPASCR